MSIGLNSVTPRAAPTLAQAQPQTPDTPGARGSTVLAPTRATDIVSRPSSNTQTAASPALSALQAVDAATGSTDSASAAGRTILASLGQIRRAVVVATDPSVTASQRTVLTQSVQAQVGDIGSTVASAGFGGVNLLDGSASAGVALAIPTDGSSPITLQGADLTPGGGVVTVSADADLSTPESARAVLARVDGSTAAVHTVVGLVDAQGRSLAAHAEALAGSPSATGSDSTANADAAGLLALQVRQQLGAGGGSIVGQASQSILSLFKDRAA